LSRTAFLGRTENLSSLIAEDEAALGRIGVSFEKLASWLDVLLAAAHDSRTREATVNEKLHVRLRSGSLRICPWSPRALATECLGKGIHYASSEWGIDNRRTGRVLTGTGLMVHLMHDHHFCGGRESAYRVDPVALARLLELA
jgi:hypothetical protein